MPQQPRAAHELVLTGLCVCAQTSSFSIPSARSRASPSPKQNISPRDADEQLVRVEPCLECSQQHAACYTIAAPPGQHTCADDLHVCLQEVTGREDSESYAKRTITEIETCLGFTFHGADGPEEAPPEAISTGELEVSLLG